MSRQRRDRLERLVNNFLISTIEIEITDTVSAVQDDCDGDQNQKIVVGITDNGVMWIETHRGEYEFRSYENPNFTPERFHAPPSLKRTLQLLWCAIKYGREIMRARGRSRTNINLPADIVKLLGSELWLRTLRTNFLYRAEDLNQDTSIQLDISFIPCGDAIIGVTADNCAIMPLRLRGHSMFGGGSANPCLRIAVIVLAEAIRRTNESPQ